MNLDLSFLKLFLCEDLHEIVDDVVKSLQVFARSHDYAIFITRSKSHKSRRLEISVDVLYFQCSKDDKFTLFIIIKRKRGMFKMIECSFSMIARENRSV